MDQKFTFTSGQKRATFIMMALGLLCILIGVFMAGDDAGYGINRVWTNLLHNSVFFLGISLLALLFLAAFTTALAGWHVMFKRVMEALTAFLPVGGALIIIIAICSVLGLNDIYYWMTEGLTDPASENFDKVINSKKGFLNIPAFLSSTVLFVVVWSFFGSKLRSLSYKEDSAEPGTLVWYKKMRFWSAAFLPIGMATSAFAFWYWLMSIEPHWYSTMFAWYATGSLMASAIAAIILILIYLQSKGYYQELLMTHYHDLGKYLFAFSIFWTYLWFDQYMLIWYANIGEETVHFQNQINHFPVIFYGMLFLNFVLPLLILMRNSTKWKKGSLVFMCIVILFGHWLDFYLMTKMGVYIELSHHAAEAHGAGHADHALPFLMGYNIPGLIEIGTMIGFLGAFIFVTLNALSKAPALVAKNDPYIQESLHHAGGPLGPELEVEHH